MNEVERKEIEEMAKVLPDTLPDLFDKDRKIILGKSFKGQIAREYYNAGYGKVEDYKKEIERLKEANERLKNDKCVTIGIDKEEIIKTVDKTVKYNVKKIKRQAVRDFAEKIKQAICDNTYPYFDKDGKPVNIWNSDGFDKIDELLKEYEK